MRLSDSSEEIPTTKTSPAAFASARYLHCPGFNISKDPMVKIIFLFSDFSFLESFLEIFKLKELLVANFCIAGFSRTFLLYLIYLPPLLNSSI